MASNDRIGRTPDGVRYKIEEEPGFAYTREAAGMGELVRLDESISDLIYEVSRSVRVGLRASQASTAKIQFGLTLSARAGFVVTRGTSEANIVITLEYDTLDREQVGHGD